MLARTYITSTIPEALYEAADLDGATQLQYFIHMKYSDDPAKASRMISSLASYRAVHNSIYGIFVHFTGDDYVYSSTSFFLLDRFVSNALIFENTDSEELKNLLEHTASLSILPAQYVSGYAVTNSISNRAVLAILVPLSYPGGARVGTVMYLVDEQVYLNWFRDCGLQDTDVFMRYRDQVIIRQRRSDIAEETLLEAVHKEQRTLQANGQIYHALWEKGTASLSCALYISDQEFDVAISGSLKALVLVAALIAAIAILIITRFVQSRMKGVNLLRSMLTDHPANGNELLEIRDGIQRLIDENTSMTTRLETMADAQRSEFVRRFLLNGFSDEDSFLQMAENVAVNVDTQYFAVAILAKAAESTYELTTDKIDRLFDENVSGASLTLVSAESHLVLVAFANEKETLRSFLESKFAGLKACCKSITMGVSNYHNAWTEGQRAYLEADSAFEMRFVKGSMAPIFFSDLDENQASESNYNRQVVDHLRSALRKGEIARMEKALAEVSQAMHNTRSSLFGFRCMYSEIITAVSTEAQANGINEEELYDLFRLSRCLSVDELDGILNQVCKKIVTLQTQPEKEDIPESVKKAYEMIQRRFSEPGLTVSGIAAEVGMSDSKLSLEFKRVYQETPLECITASRMNRAKRLLSTTQMPVKDIALECGYYDISAFNRRFKTYMSLTPQQYRQQNGMNPDR